MLREIFDKLSFRVLGVNSKNSKADYKILWIFLH